jgi:hypothetical protein
MNRVALGLIDPNIRVSKGQSPDSFELSPNKRTLIEGRAAAGQSPATIAYQMCLPSREPRYVLNNKTSLDVSAVELSKLPVKNLRLHTNNYLRSLD